MSCFSRSATQFTHSDIAAPTQWRALLHSLAPRESSPLQVRPSAQIVLLESGELQIAVADKSWRLRRGEALWIPPFHFYKWRAISRCRAHLISAPTGFARDRAPVEASTLCVDNLFCELTRRLETAPFPYDADGHFGRISALLGEMVEWRKEVTVVRPAVRDERLCNIEEALLCDPSDHRTLQQWAESCGVSCRTLARLFQKEAGQCFCDWRNQLRLSIALPMLLRGESVTTVAFNVGFESSGTFTTMFRRALGVSPTQYVASSQDSSGVSR